METLNQIMKFLNLSDQGTSVRIGKAGEVHVRKGLVITKMTLEEFYKLIYMSEETTTET